MYKHYCNDCHHTWTSNNKDEPCTKCNGMQTDCREIEVSYGDPDFQKKTD